MIRRLSAALSVLSLVMCVGFAMGWVRARFATDFFEYARGGRSVTIIVIDKSLLLMLIRCEPPQMNPGWTHSPNRADPGYTARYNPTIWGKAGFYSEHNEVRDETGFATTRVVGLPFWLLCLLTAVPPAMFLTSARRRRIRAMRQKQNRCTTCGYDLPAAGDTCPECGTAVPAKGTG